MSKSQIIPTTEVTSINKTSATLVAKATRLEVAAVEDENNAYDILGEIKKRLKEIEKRRTSITKPLLESKKAADTLFKALSEPFKQADQIIRDKVLVFRKEQEKKAQAEQERREKIQAAHEAKGHETHQLEEVEPDVGESVVTKRWTFEVTRLGNVPRKFLMIDNVKIRAAIRDGMRSIPGLRIFQEEGLRV